MRGLTGYILPGIPEVELWGWSMVSRRWRIETSERCRPDHAYVLAADTMIGARELAACLIVSLEAHRASRESREQVKSWAQWKAGSLALVPNTPWK